MTPSRASSSSPEPRALPAPAAPLILPADGATSSFSMRMLESNRVPDWLIRNRIRALLAERLREEDKGDPERQQAHLMDLVRRLRESPIAINTAEANEQHYEVPTEFYLQVLGKHLKYSSCHYESFDVAKAAPELEAAEARMLALTCKRARLADGERILELGCGWGSLSLWMAAKYPNARITGVSNSRTQKQFIDAQAAERGLANLEILTCDVNRLQFDDGRAFDRVVSVEMFEHMRNYESLLARVASWMAPAATLFVHIFTHHRFAYPFEVRDERTGWRSISSPAASCRAMTCCCISRVQCGWSITGTSTVVTTS